MRRFARAVVFAISLSTVVPGCSGYSPEAPHPPAPGSISAEEATSPAGGSASPTGLAARLLARAREFHGNPWPLGVLVGAVLVIALGLGVVTLRIAYRGR